MRRALTSLRVHSHRLGSGVHGVVVAAGCGGDNDTTYPYAIKLVVCGGHDGETVAYERACFEREARDTERAAALGCAPRVYTWYVVGFQFVRHRASETLARHLDRAAKLARESYHQRVGLQHYYRSKWLGVLVSERWPCTLHTALREAAINTSTGSGGWLAQARWCAETRVADKLHACIARLHHDGKIVHSDLHDSNVVVRGSGAALQVALVDFGLAMRLDDDHNGGDPYAIATSVIYDLRMGRYHFDPLIATQFKIWLDLHRCIRPTCKETSRTPQLRDWPLWAALAWAAWRAHEDETDKPPELDAAAFLSPPSTPLS